MISTVAPGRSLCMVDVIRDFMLSRKMEGKWTKRTEDYYEMHLQYFLRSAPPYLHEIDKQFILDYLDKMGRGKRGRPAPYMLQGSYRALKALFNWCVGEGYIDRSPINFKIGKPVDRVHVPPTKEQIKMILDSFGTDFLGRRNRALLLLYANTGARLNEILADPKNDRTGILDIHVNFETREVLLFGKGRKERIVGISPNTAKAMYIYNQMVRKRWPVKKTSAFWVTEEGRPLTGEAYRQVMQDISNRLNIDLTTHDLRRYFITAALEGGMNETAVMHLTGHTSHQMIQRYSKTYQAAHARQQLEKISPVAGL